MNRRRVTRSALILVAAAFLFTLGSCHGKAPVDKLKLPATPVLTLRAGWGVVDQPYARVLESPDDGAPIRAHIRRGTVVEITAKTNYTDVVEDERDNWYQVRLEDVDGWIFGANLSLYDSRQQAENASELLEK